MWRAWVILLTSAACVTAGAQEPKPSKTTTAASHARTAHHNAKHAVKKKTEPFVKQGPVAPPPQAASTGSGAEAVVEPVVVTYDQGTLAITTHDAPLRDVLNKVGEATGAVVEAPSLDQRVTVKVPAEAPAQAIAALLDGLHLDYAMLGGTGDGDPVRRIIISPRGSAMRSGPAMAAMVPSEQTGGDAGVIEAPPARPARDH